MGIGLEHAFIVHSDELFFCYYCIVLCYILCELYTW